MQKSGCLVIYIGGSLEVRRRMIFRQMPPTFKSLVLAPDPIIPELQLLAADHVIANATPSSAKVRPIFNSRQIRYRAYGVKAEAELARNNCDHIFFAQVDGLFPQQRSFVDWLYSLGMIALQQEATVIFDVSSQIVRVPAWWEHSLLAMGIHEADFIRFWLTNAEDPVRYARLQDGALKRYLSVYVQQHEHKKNISTSNADMARLIRITGTLTNLNASTIRGS